MIVTSLIASTIYFVISPFHSETSQLEAFKEATIFDCMLALFGGFAWFLGIHQKRSHQSNCWCGGFTRRVFLHFARQVLG